jgi:hypothetical protein
MRQDQRGAGIHRRLSVVSQIKLVGQVAPKAGRISCPWCEKGALEHTPAEYGDPPTVVYCPECSSVFTLTAVPELSP